MKSLEKDRRRRDETAADMARDVQRFLDQQPVVARPPSSWYRFTRFARRNRTMFVATVLVLSALVSGTIISTWQAVNATIAQRETEQLRREAVESVDKLKKSNVLLDSARANADEQRWALALGQYTKAIELQPNHYFAWSGRGALLARLGGWHIAADDYVFALNLGEPANNPAWWGVPQLCYLPKQNKAYQEVCDRMKSQLETTDDLGQIPMIVRAMCIQPRSEHEIKPLAFQMEALIFEQDQKDIDRPGHRGMSFRPKPGQGPPGQRLPFPVGPADSRLMLNHILKYSAGIANYRAGNAQRSLELLSQLRIHDEGGPFGTMASPVMALAFHETGQPDLARQELADAKSFIDEWLTEMEESPEGPRMPWFDFLELCIWHAEATTVIQGYPPQADQRLLELEGRAGELLRQSLQYQAN
ncbi:hypothetical protein [Bremerella alba]|uniref:Tetratricopeptide repeat protein n=1 Tax=Bremerella alba TaxID=980252 RepID=A0A7V9A7K0_9BACT|nr:hypothetical protein [Bremerella alba]MBA2115447.1 hypothetical protein [Bremerella alba]